MIRYPAFGARTLAVLACAVAPTLSAQRSVVFQHGLMSSGATWTQEANALAAVFDITPFLPTTSSSSIFATQASQLTSQVTSAGADAILIGHSNGGLIGRVANMPSPYPGRPWGGIVTIGTPHSGAPLAATVADGEVGNWLSYLNYEFWDPIDYYYPLVNPDVDQWGWAYVQFALDAFDDASNILVTIGGGLSALYVNSAYPVLADMAPYAAMIGTLNSAQNLSREASAVPTRIGITSVLSSNSGMVFKGITSNWQSKRDIQMGLSALYLGIGAYFAAYSPCDTCYDPNAIEEQVNAWRWVNFGLDAYVMDDAWCQLIGAWNGASCGANDAIVPAWSQAYPGPSAQQRTITGPSHIQETSSSQLDQRLRDILANTFHIPPPGGGGGGSLSVSITGPSNVKPGATCEWFATVSDGTPPYSYSWTPGGYTGDDYDYTNSVGDGGSFTMAVTVTDANGAHGSASELVHVKTSAMACPN
jgi:pimeloyl-ACP methyl ester carboxylesterase